MGRRSDAVHDGAADAGPDAALDANSVDDVPATGGSLPVAGSGAGSVSGPSAGDGAGAVTVAPSGSGPDNGPSAGDGPAGVAAAPVIDVAAAPVIDSGASTGNGAAVDDDREPSADPSIDPDGGVPARSAAVGFAVFPTALGECGIAWGPDGITGIHLPEESGDAVRAALASAQEGAFEAVPPREVQDVMDRIVALLGGRSRDDLADVRLDMSQLSGFLQRAYAITRTITPGHTMTYGQIAERLGSPGLARAVGRAMGANPFPIIVPCHRVLGADGSIGGFSAHGGALTKRRMLLAEGVPEQDGPALFGAEQLFG